MANEIARSLRKRMTPHEVKLWVQIRLLDEGHFRRQVPIGPYIVDFAEKSGKLVIELDGSQHGEELHVAKDMVRAEYLKNRRFKVLRIWNAEVDENMSGVIDTILLALK